MIIQSVCHKKMKKMKKKILLFIILLILGYIVYFIFSLRVKPPKISNKSAMEIPLNQISDSLWQCGDSWLKLNDKGLWEMFVSGSPFELGVKAGKLTKELNEYQEQTFVDQLKKMIPSESYLNKLKYIIAIFNRNIENYVPIENQEEIYGYSQFASEKYNFIAPNYHRMLNYHAAHDIGHALQNMNLVACTAFGVWGKNSTDSSLIIARNFDFYMGEDFAKNKIIAFYQPQKGYPFMTVTWAGMTGVLSGMNKEGLTVTLNAAKSGIPFSAKTPVSILARNILQHAKNIDEAYEIAKKAETFVSESFLIGSANDEKAVVIEKSPEKIDLYDPKGNEIMLTNHFQSKTFKNTDRTIKNREETATNARLLRVKDLLKKKQKHNVLSLVSILRNPYDIGDIDIGMGNEIAINQFVAHHGIVFKPKQKQVWISTAPYQMGEMLMYDLNKIFSTPTPAKFVYEPEQTIQKDTFIYSKKYKNFLKYRQLTEQYRGENSKKLTSKEIEHYISLNEHYYYVWFIGGQKYLQNGDTTRAYNCFKKALMCKIPRKVDEEQVENAIKELTK